MKSFGEILKELGFNPDSSLAVQKAFFKHLAKEAASTLSKKEVKIKTKPKNDPVQLEFDLDTTKRVS